MSTTSFAPNSAERVVQKTFLGDGCLFRDAQGARVLADEEGEGRWRVTAESPTEVIVDGIPATVDEGVFFSHVRILGRSPGRVSFRIHRSPPPFVGEPVEVPLPFKGSGWFVRSSGAVFADGDTDVAAEESPFFQSLVGSGRAMVRIAGPAWTRIDPVRIEGGASKPHPETGCLSVLNRCTVHLEVPEGGPVRLIRTYDRFHGRQRARISVDGTGVGWWRDSEESRTQRMGTSSFGLELLAGPAIITIAPQPGSALWSIGEIHALILRS